MSDGMKVKADSVEELHAMIVDMIALAVRYEDKYPNFSIAIEVSHDELTAGFTVSRDE